MILSLGADRAVVAEKEAQISELEAQIAVLEESISVLRASKKPAEDRLNSHKYPVLTLPNEIVSEIFQHYLPTYPEPPEFFEGLSPTTLTQICRQWREIAFSTPALWRAIDLRPINASLEAANKLAPLWLERSGHLPLSIYGTDAKGLFPAFSASIPHCARWEHLHLSLDNPSNLKALDVATPLLRTLTLYINHKTVSAPHQFQYAPLLRSVVLEDCHSPSVILPWSQLTSLALMCMYTREFPPILRQTSNLVHCTLLMRGGDPLGNGPDYDDITLSRLETLVFESDNDTDVVFFKHLVTPALVCLELAESFLSLDGFGAAIAPHGGVVGSLEAFISKSGCQLRELKITKATVSQEIYRHAFPSISVINCTIASW
ncbi:F-box domain-containing protein [Favolaschia claudopus]|uniref:F-box domain-containing protein n=1 Tax=Favolaschia claudopus TaxID=2862362 RepID=A0AAW0ANL7_9AGAR